MVLWEIALATAYFLGLKPTYRHVLHIQRRLISPSSPKIRHFLQSKTRSIFDITLKVHREVQKRDITIGKSLGNWIQRWIEKVEPTVKIQGGSGAKYTSNMIRLPKKQLSDFGNRISARGEWYKDSRKRLVASSRNLLLTAYPTVSRLLRRNNIQYRQLVSGRVSGFGNGVVRGDIMQWLSHG